MANDGEFSRMAERVRAVPDDEFGGAVVIRPPGEEVDAIAFVIADPHPDPVQFWASVKTRVEIAYAEAMGRAEGQQGGGWPRR